MITILETNIIARCDAMKERVCLCTHDKTRSHAYELNSALIYSPACAERMCVPVHILYYETLSFQGFRFWRET